MTDRIQMYIGTVQEEFEEFLCADLIVGDREILIHESSTSIDNLSPEQFLDELGKLVNTAKLFSDRLHLGIEYELDDYILTLDTEDAAMEVNIKKLLNEISHRQLK